MRAGLAMLGVYFLKMQHWFRHDAVACAQRFASMGGVNAARNGGIAVPGMADEAARVS
jgi:hypothetical protein